MEPNKLWDLIKENSFHPLNLCIEKNDSYSKSQIEEIESNLNVLLLDSPRTSGIDSLMKRLADKDEFAGAREELEIAAHFKRYGFKNLKLKPLNSTDIELPTNPTIYIEVSLQHYPETEKKIDDDLATGKSNKMEPSDDEIYSIINNVLSRKFKQLESKHASIVLILDFGYSESYERVIKDNIEKFNIPDFIIGIIFRTKTNIFKFNSSFFDEKVKETLSLLQSPSLRAGSLYGRK